MSNKVNKVLLPISISMNILLLLIVTWGFMKMNFVKEQVFITEVQHNLVELEGLIAHELDDNWSEPNLVTTKLAEILKNIRLGMTTGNQLGMLSKSDNEILDFLNATLAQFPHDNLYEFVDLTEEDKRNFEELREILREVGLGLNITIDADMSSFLKQAKEITEKFKY